MRCSSERITKATVSKVTEKTITMQPQPDGTFRVRELSAKEIEERRAAQERAERFERIHGLPEDQYLALWHRQSQLCGECSAPITVEESCFEYGDRGAAIFGPCCSMTMMVRADRARFGGSDVE